MLPKNISKILVIKLRAIGDVLLSTPVIQNLHEYYPAAQIDFLVDRFAAEVVIGNPWISDVITFDRKNDSSLSLIRRVRERRYELIIDLFSNPRSAVVTALSGARYRVGFPFGLREYAYNITVPPRTGNIHNVDFNLDALRRLDIPVRPFHPYFPIVSASKSSAEAWLRQEGLADRLLVGFNPGGGWYTKRWGLEHYAQLADRISREHDAVTLLLWGPGEEGDARAVQTKMTTRSLLIPKTSVSELGALIQHCAFIVSNDSGPMHIAASLGVPTLGIFGPTNPRQQGPYGEEHRWVRNEKLDCLECALTSCPIGNVCMTQLDVDRVMEAFEQLRRKAGSQHPPAISQMKEV